MVSRPLVSCYFGQYKITSSFQDKPKRVQVMKAGQEEEVTQVGHCEQGYVKLGEESVASEIRS